MEREEIMSIPNTSEMAVDAKVHETNIDKVARGQIARIVVDAVPDQAFYGQVLKISPLPDPAAFMANPDLKVYTTEVSLEGGSMLRPGMSAKVEIILAQLKDVLVVPVQCIANRGGKKICYIHGSSSEPREVKTGPYNDKFVQIIEGLSEGDKVLLNPPKVFDQPQNNAAKNDQIPASLENKIPSEVPAQNGQPGSPDSQRPRRQRPEGQVAGEGQPSDGQTERPRRQRPEGQLSPDGQQSDGPTEQPRRQRSDTPQAGTDRPAMEPQQ
jgi:hypothetical protein